MRILRKKRVLHRPRHEFHKLRVVLSKILNNDVFVHQTFVFISGKFNLLWFTQCQLIKWLNQIHRRLHNIGLALNRHIQNQILLRILNEAIKAIFVLAKFAVVNCAVSLVHAFAALDAGVTVGF